MATDYYKELRRLLMQADCEFRRQGRGDHEIWFSPLTNRPFTVDRKGKRRRTANATLKAAGLPKAF